MPCFARGRLNLATPLAVDLRGEHVAGWPDAPCQIERGASLARPDVRNATALVKAQHGRKPCGCARSLAHGLVPAASGIERKDGNGGGNVCPGLPAASDVIGQPRFFHIRGSKVNGSGEATLSLSKST